MKFFIIAPSLTVHIEDDYYTTDETKVGICGVRSFPDVCTHAFQRLSFQTGETLPACKNCETVFLGRYANLIKNRAA